MFIDTALLDWLLAGDPMIRWQVMRDLLHEPEDIGRAEQAKVVTSGWGAEFLRQQRPNGAWPKGRWTDTPWTLMQLLDYDMPTDLASLRNGAAVKTCCTSAARSLLASTQTLRRSCGSGVRRTTRVRSSFRLHYASFG